VTESESSDRHASIVDVIIVTEQNDEFNSECTDSVRTRLIC